MVKDLHGDEHGKPRRRWDFEELVIVCAHVVCAQLMREIALEKRRQERSRVDHCIAPGGVSHDPYRPSGASIHVQNIIGTWITKKMKYSRSRLRLQREVAVGSPRAIVVRRSPTRQEDKYHYKQHESANLFGMVTITIPTHQESKRVVRLSPCRQQRV